MYMNEYVYTIIKKNICLCMRCYICIQLMYVYERICIYDKCKKYMSLYVMLYMYKHMYVHEQICDKCKTYMSVFGMLYMYTTYVCI